MMFEKIKNKLFQILFPQKNKELVELKREKERLKYEQYLRYRHDVLSLLCPANPKINKKQDAKIDVDKTLKVGLQLLASKRSTPQSVVAGIFLIGLSMHIEDKENKKELQKKQFSTIHLN